MLLLWHMPCLYIKSYVMFLTNQIWFVLKQHILFRRRCYHGYWIFNILFLYIQYIIDICLFQDYNLPERVQILGHVHIICITVREDRIICCQIFFDLLLKSAFEWIFNVMQLILVKIKWHIKWKYLIQKFHDICLSYYFKWTTYYYNEVNSLFERDPRFELFWGVYRSCAMFSWWKKYIPCVPHNNNCKKKLVHTTWNRQIPQ
jgi:hypothetical protein